MDSILENYVSSPSPSRTPGSPSSPYARVSLAKTQQQHQHLLLSNQLTNDHRDVYRKCTRHDDSFVFHAYVAKRQRRGYNHEEKLITTATKLFVTENVDCSNDLPLDESKMELSDVTKRNLQRIKPLWKQKRQRFVGHTNAVNGLQWHPSNPDLFLSASMDATMRIWKSAPQEQNERCRRKLMHHRFGVANAKWSQNGQQILSGGYDGMAYCIDAETGQVRQKIRRPDVGTALANIERITTVHFHPTESNSVLLGTDKGHIYCHDLRLNSCVTTYSKSFGDVHDLLFLDDNGQRFVSSAGIRQRDASNQTLLVWDWRSATLLYDRLDNNMLAHSCVRKHPFRPYFVAQCSGNYATLYSLRAPYKCVKGPSVGGRRLPLYFRGSHEVEGYRVQGSFSRDGALWASGDARGRVVLYRASGAREQVESFQLYGRSTACICAEFQPFYKERSDLLLTGSGDGDIDMFRQ
ncbi:unnamed protein product [Peronospora belbahrii]|uniref:Anaphase-promoting complex subunit 4 WD40 domain-containing protein n=1 Tax=Peronospora belbahrii TaxID=622444 RepID=A0AAU9L8Z6_9STRA|nr:unnamed protein product [Peronospora belbahrii]CAH0521466.1 unnamed protein product [Peronospora belbahrii]